MPISITSRAPRARYAALLIALPLLAGCSAAGGHAATSASPSSKAASSGSSSSADVKPPCDYLSAADASAIIGTTLTTSEVNGACSYTGGAEGFATTVNGGITGANDPVWKNEVKALKSEAGSLTTLSGVGDEAYGGDGSIEEKIVVRSGQWVIEVADADDSTTTTFPKSIAVAKAIISNLG